MRSTPRRLAPARVERSPVGVLPDGADRAAYGLLPGLSWGGRGEPPRRGTGDHLAAYDTMPWLRAVANKVATAVASTPWRLYVPTRGGAAVRAPLLQRAPLPQRAALLNERKGAGELREIESHPLLDLLDSANSYLTGLAARKLTQIYLDLVGDSFLVKERNGLGAPVAVWPVPPSWVLGLPTPDHRFFRVGFRGWQGEIPDTEMLWLCDPSPQNPYGRGSGVSQALADELETDEYASKHCHDPETECLTRRGWVRGLDLTMDDEIATWNEERDRLEYQRPVGITRAPFRGELHHWTGRSVDALVTPTHRLWIESRIYARPAHPGPLWHFEESQQAAEKPGRIFRWRDAGRYDGNGWVVSISAAARMTKRTPGSRGGGRPPARGVDDPLSFDALAFARFLGYYVSEGNTDRAGIQIAQTAGPYVDDIREALQIFPASWVLERASERAGKLRYRWTVRHHGLTEWLRAHVGEGAAAKRLPAEVFEWPTVAQQQLLESLVNGDGSWVRGDERSSAVYVTRSKGLADDVQRLCVQLGHSSLVTGRPNRGQVLYHVNIRLDCGTRSICKADGTWMRPQPYDGLVWCVTVPNERFFSRRNGRVMLGGNTKAWFYNRARPDVIIAPSNPQDSMNLADIKRLEQDWTSKTQGFWRAFKPYFSSRGISVHELSQTFENMQLVQLRQHERDTIVQVWGVPPEVLGVIENSNRATIDAADYLFSRWVIVPRLEFLRASYQERLVPEYDDRLILDYVSPIKEDRQGQLEAARVAPFALLVDEWRELMGYPPLPDGKGQIHVMPATSRPIPDLSDPPPPPPAAAPPAPAAPPADGQTGS